MKIFVERINFVFVYYKRTFVSRIYCVFYYVKWILFCDSVTDFFLLTNICCPLFRPRFKYFNECECLTKTVVFKIIIPNHFQCSINYLKYTVFALCFSMNVCENGGKNEIGYTHTHTHRGQTPTV